VLSAWSWHTGVSAHSRDASNSTMLALAPTASRTFFFQSDADYRDLHSFPTRRSSDLTNLTSKEAKLGKVMRHTLGASLNIRHNLSSSKGPKPLQLKLLTTYIPKTSAFTLAFSTSQRLRTTRASARTFFTF